jgi:CHAT domain-containing protein
VADKTAQIATARALAKQFFRERRDSFLLKELDRFEQSTPSLQRSSVVADSLRIAGNNAMSSSGAAASMPLWRAALGHARLSRSPATIAAALVSLGAGHYRAGRMDSAVSYLESAKIAAERVGDKRTLANAIGVLASIAKDSGDGDRAVRLYASASALRKAVGDTRGIAADQNNIGLIARSRGDYSAANKAFTIALRLNNRDHRNALVALNYSNLAGVASDLSDFHRSDSLYRLALSINRAEGNRAESGFVLHDLGRMLMRSSDYTGASAALQQALEVHQEMNDTLEAISTRTDLAGLYTAMGNPELALASLRVAERDANAITAAHQERADLALARGNVAIAFGSLSEAQTAFVLAANLAASIDNEKTLADAKYGQATICFLRNEYPQALSLLGQTLAIQSKFRDERGSALTRMLMASAEMGRNSDWRARSHLDAAKRAFHQMHDPAGEAAVVEMLGNLALRADSVQEAEKLFRSGIVLLGDRSANDIRSRLYSGLGTALQARGALVDATVALKRAIEIAERSASRIIRTDRKYGFLDDKWSTYVNLSIVEHSRGLTADAFSTSERLRARQMVEFLSSGAAPVSRLRESDRAYAKTISAATSSRREIAARLSSDEVLIEYLLGDSLCTVFVLTRDTLASVVLPINRDELRDLVAFSRRAIAVPPRDGSEGLWPAPLRRLYSTLISPVEQRGFLRGKRRLVIVPHAELHFVSFASLLAAKPGGKFLVETFDIEYAPSATAWVRLASRPTIRRPTHILAMAPNVDRLPASRTEVESIGRLYGRSATVRVGRDASIESLRRDLPHASALHLATFGVLNKRNPLFSFVKLAPSHDSDGRLAVNDVLALGLSGQTVILSACQTALGWGANGDVPAGDDWIGLVQSFLQGGAKSVVATLWPVDDRATSMLMRQYHSNSAAGKGVSEALALSQRDAIRNKKTSSPFYWAAFVANGR